MKYIKYIIFTITMLFCSIVVYDAATCTYGNTELFYECVTGSNNAVCTIKGTKSGNYELSSWYEKPSNKAIEKCDYIYVREKSGTIYGFYQNFPYDYESVDITKVNKYNEFAETTTSCKFGDDTFSLYCTTSKSGNKGSCNIDGTKRSKYKIMGNELNNDVIKSCSNVYVYYTSVGEEITIFSLSGTKETPPGNSKVTTLSKYVSGSSQGDNKFTTTPTPNDNNPSGDTPVNSEDLDFDNFCQGKVLGVFTALGWVFFIIKIVIPIILMIFGAIDFSKAVISSKDDEIKKTTMSLVTRAVCGIIIFFIPTALNVVVNLVGNRADDVYHGTFADCTSCMLKPNQSICKGLLGDY